MTSASSRPYRVGRSRTGLGLFATAPIKKGKFIVEYTGRKLPNKIADELDNRYLFEINSRWTVDGSTRRNIARYINHSCRPNAESDVIGHKVIIRAIKNIPEGAEITYDYGKDYFTTFLKPIGCRCAACVEKRRRARAEARAAAARKRARAERKAKKAKEEARKAKAAKGRKGANGAARNGANGHAAPRRAKPEALRLPSPPSPTFPQPNPGVPGFGQLSKGRNRKHPISAGGGGRPSARLR